MKKIFYSYLLFAVTCFLSCSKSNPADDESGNGGGYVSGTYWPLALHNSWKLVDAEGDENSYIVNKVIAYQGKNYFQFQPEGEYGLMNFPLSMSEDNGVFRMHYGETEFNGVKTSEGSIIQFNTNEAVGKVWKDEMTIQVSGGVIGALKFTHEGKIYAKSQSEVIKGKTYKNVLKIELNQNIYNSISDITFDLTYNVWLAYGIGIIYEKVEDEFGTMIYELETYKVN